jgi:hypothetical protein
MRRMEDALPSAADVLAAFRTRRKMAHTIVNLYSRLRSEGGPEATLERARQRASAAIRTIGGSIPEGAGQACPHRGADTAFR